MADTNAAEIVFALDVSFLLPDNKREIHFGLSKSTNTDGSDDWVIDFELKEKIGEELKSRVKIHLMVKDKNKAKKLADAKKLSQAKANLLLGKVQLKAASLPPGTTKNQELEDLLQKLV